MYNKDYDDENDEDSSTGWCKEPQTDITCHVPAELVPPINSTFCCPPRCSNVPIETEIEIRLEKVPIKSFYCSAP